MVLKALAEKARRAELKCLGRAVSMRPPSSGFVDCAFEIWVRTALRAVLGRVGTRVRTVD